jgi:hypothetical protein
LNRQEKTTTYWNIGKHIHHHILKHEDWTDYEDALVTLLSSELNIGAST